VALIAARPVVVEVEPEVWALLYGDVVVTVQVSLVPVPSLPQLIKDCFSLWLAKFVHPEVADSVRLPPAVNALPSITFEALDPEPLVIGVVSS
jgi:hypothetical protein